MEVKPSKECLLIAESSNEKSIPNRSSVFIIGLVFIHSKHDEIKKEYRMPLSFL